MSIKRLSQFRSLAVLGGIALATPIMSHAGVVFDDVFTGGSTVDTAATAQTANSTSYEWFSGITGGTATAPGGSLGLSLPSTTSVVGEVQAMFSTSYVTLQSIGDTISIQVVFNDTANVMLTGNASSSLAIGLFNSGGAAPNTGVVAMNTGNTTGGSQNWKGFASIVLESSGSNRLITRGPQGANGTTSQNQDLLFNGASGSQTFNNPVGAQVASKSDTAEPVSMTAGNLYTNYMQITMTAPGVMSVSNQVSGASGILFNSIGSANLGTLNFATNSFDSFAIGWRESVAAATTSTMTIDEITVSTIIPEPATFALAGLGILGLMMARRSRD